jgi:hypothetical protein
MIQPHVDPNWDNEVIALKTNCKFWHSSNNNDDTNNNTYAIMINPLVLIWD